MSNTKNNQDRVVTIGEIQSIINSSDKNLVFDIFNIKPTCNEVIQAVEWFEMRDYMGVTFGEVTISRVSQIYKILEKSYKSPS